MQQQAENFGNGLIRFGDVRTVGANSGTQEVEPGENVSLRLRIIANVDEPNLTVGMEIRDGFGEIVFGTNSHLRGKPVAVRANCEYEVTYSFPANLNRGRYQIGGALHTGADHLACCYQWCDKLGELDIVQLGEPEFVGYCRLEPKLEWQEVSSLPGEKSPAARVVT